MKRILAFLTLASCALAGTWLASPGKGSHGSIAATYIYQQNFNITETPVGLGGGADYDYTTSPAPLEGAQSAFLDNTGVYSGTIFTAESEIWVYFLFNATSTTITQLFAFYDSGYSSIAHVSVSAGTVTITCGSASANTSGTIGANTTYSCWVHYLKGTGANATAEVHISTTTTKPADASALHAKTTTGTSTVDCAEFEFNQGGANDIITDNWFFDDATIGSNPS